MNVAIFTLDFQWAGGVDFLHGLVKGLSTQTKREIKIFILVHDPSIVVKKSKYKRIVHLARKTVGMVVYPARIVSLLKSSEKPKLNDNTAVDYNQIQNIKEIFSNEKVEIIYYRDSGYESSFNILKKINADIVLPILYNRFPHNFPIPWIGYIFDFVYKHHTHLYTKDFCLHNDLNYITTLLNAKSVIVNSKEVYKDLYKFIPYAKSKVYHLPFAPYTNEQTYKAAVAEISIVGKYNIKHPYFIISNQFWLHKSHETAFEALKILRDNYGHSNIDIVCTGRMTDLSGTDERKNQLLKFVYELELTNSIHFVGHISKIDQLALMLRSVAVLQPTLFEGGPGGGSVYMAVANGVPAIVSDIDVNKEIEKEPLVTFFKVLDSNDLASKMHNSLLINREILSYNDIEMNNKQRLALLGEVLINCFDYTMHHKLDIT